MVFPIAADEMVESGRPRSYVVSNLQTPVERQARLPRWCVETESLSGPMTPGGLHSTCNRDHGPPILGQPLRGLTYAVQCLNHPHAAQSVDDWRKLQLFASLRRMVLNMLHPMSEGLAA